MSARTLRAATVAACFVTLALSLGPVSAHAQNPNWGPSVVWNTYLGGGMPDGGTDTAFTRDELEGLTNLQGDLVVTGQTSALTFPAGAGLPDTTSKLDALVARVSDDGQTLKWARVFGGTGNDLGTRVAVGISGDVFVVGTTESSGIRVAPGIPAPLATAYASFGGGARDAYLARLDANGELLWFMYLGGIGDDSGKALALSPMLDAVYVVGQTTSQTFPGAGVNYGSSDVFVTKVAVSSDKPSVLWTRVLGSAEDDVAYSVSTRGQTVYVGGVMGAAASGGLIPINAFAGGPNDGFVAALRDDNTVEWFTLLGGSGDDDVRAVLPRPDGSLAVVGNTKSTGGYPDYSPTARQTENVFVAGLTADGQRRLDQVVQVGMEFGDDRTEGQAAIDARGNVFVGGRTTSSADLGFGFHGFSKQRIGPNDGFVSMVDATLTRIIWDSFVGGNASEEEWVQGLYVGAGGQVTLSGRSNASTDLLLRGVGGLDLTANGGMEGFLFRVRVDDTEPYNGTVTATSNSQGQLTAQWSFQEPDSDIIKYEVGIGLTPQGVEARGFEDVGTNTRATFTTFIPTRGTAYYIRVRATNSMGMTSEASSEAVVVGGGGNVDAGTGTDAGTDAGTDGGTQPGPDAGTGADGGTGEDEDLPPLGFSCGSTGGGSLAGVLALMALALLALRRARG